MVFSSVYQAEDADFVGPLLFTGRGAEGTGYLDYQNLTGDFIEWTVDVPTAGTYDLSWRYANGQTNRPLELSVNGTPQVASLNFPSTGSWTDWNLVNQSITLSAGTNTIRLKAIGSSGANFDFLRVTEATTTTPRSVTISNAAATEGTNSFLVFDVSLSAVSSDPITLKLAAVDGTAKGGLIANFATNPAGGPIDYANQEFEVSSDGGNTWQPATNGTQVSFAAGQTALKVRLAVNDDTVDEGSMAETMTLKVDSVVSGPVTNSSDTGTGSIIDNDGATSSNGAPISPLPFTDVRVEGVLSLDFDGADGGVVDKDGEGIGFTMIDPASNPGNPNPQLGVVGYWADKLDVDPVSGVLKITTTNGIKYLNNDTQDNALGVGLNVPSQALRLKTTLVNLPNPVGGNAQAGLWFGKSEGGSSGGGSGTSEDNYIKLVVLSDKNGNYLVEALMEQNGVVGKKQKIDIPDNPSSVALNLFVNPTNKSVTAQYSVAGGANQTVTTFNTVPDEWFSFDQAGINPEIATRSFGGIFATHRQAAAPQVFSFDDFTITEEQINPGPSPSPSPTPGNPTFDRWSIPISNPTAMAVGPDGRLYVATLFGTIHAVTINPQTRTSTSQIISTIPNSEGGNRLTLGIAVDPDSTPDNVILWVSHSNGSVSNGALNSGKISRLSGPNFSQKTDVVTGLPRAIANHATNNIDFGPDGRLYLWQGGNTGAGSANNEPTEFKDRPEQVLSAALLAVDIPKWKANPSSFNGNVASPIGEFIDQFYARKAQELGRPYTEVQVYASGLRNTYDGVFHSNGNIYAPDNGLGVTGTVPPVPRLGSPTDRTKTTLFGQNPLDNPGSQPDPLNRIVQGGYYGHPNPYRDEVVFKTGSFQGFNANNIPPGHPAYQQPLLNLGNNRSANGTIEYTANNFFGQLKGDLLITNYSTGDNITRVKLGANGTSVASSSTLTGNFVDPLPIAMGPNGSVFVGEFNGNKVTVLEPLGLWRTDLPAAPQAVLDAGSATLGGKLYMVGGKTASSHLSSMYIYDPGNPLSAADDTWTTGLNLPGPAVENPAVAAVGGKLYVFGGSTAPFSGAVTNAAVYNPDTNPDPNITTPAWSTIAPMPTARGGATAQVINGDIYVVGGMNSSGASVNTVEIYDPETNSWSTGPSLGTRRDNPGSAVVGNRLYVFGGRTRDANGTVPNGTLNSVEVYDPLVGQWSVGTSMPTGRRTMSVGVINNRIQVIGGEATSGGSTFVQNEEYNPFTNSWRTLPSIPTGRHGAAFGTIDNVTYVAAGGPTGGSAFTTAVEAFSA
jgi:large repetitive protein